MNKKQIRKIQTATGGPLRIKFTPEQIAQFENQASRVPGMNNSEKNKYRKEGVQSQQYQEQEAKRKEEEIKSRMEMRPNIKRKATIAEKLRGKKDEYKQVPQVVGMSGADPLLSFYVGGVGLNGIGALAKTGLWNVAKHAPTTQLGNWGRDYFVGNTFKNSFNGTVPTVSSQATSLLHPTEYNISDNITLYRANPTNIKNISYKGERYGDNSGQYVGKWFTDEPSKPNWYASNMAKRGENPAYYQVTVPRYWAEKQKASHKISNPNIEYEPEDYIIDDGINGLQGQLYQERPGSIQYLQQSFQTPIMKEPSTAYFGNPTQNFLKFTGNPKLGRETAVNSIFYGAEKNLIEELKNSGVNLSKIPREAITQALNKRRKLINQTAPNSYTLVEGNPMLNFNYQLYDYRNGKPIGWMNIDRNKKDLNTYVQAVENTNPSYKGTYEKLLNSSIITSQSLGGQGSVSGLQLISAPKQYHVLQKFRNRELTPYKGTHTNAKMVYDKLGLETEDIPANSMVDLSKAGDKQTKTLLDAPVWLLKSPTSQVPTKSTVFNPYIIDSNGKMHINWNDILIQHKYGGKIK